MDSWYLTWCPECERIWRIALWTLLDDDDDDRDATPSKNASPPAKSA
jgi:hypothetical protein